VFEKLKKKVLSLLGASDSGKENQKSRSRASQFQAEGKKKIPLRSADPRRKKLQSRRKSLKKRAENPDADGIKKSACSLLPFKRRRKKFLPDLTV
jgi:hypothetical protein